MKHVLTSLASITLLLGIAVTSCSVIDNQSSGSSNGTQSSKVLIVDQNTDKYPSDPVGIRDASVAGDSLTMLVAYSGGCKPHDFKVLWNGAMTKSLPPQITVILSHDGHSDMCEAMITQDVTVSLAPLERHAANGGVIIRLEGFDRTLLYQR